MENGQDRMIPNACAHGTRKTLASGWGELLVGALSVKMAMPTVIEEIMVKLPFLQIRSSRPAEHEWELSRRDLVFLVVLGILPPGRD